MARAAIGSRLVSHHVFVPFGVRARGGTRGGGVAASAPSKYFTFKRLIRDLSVRSQKQLQMRTHIVHKLQVENFCLSQDFSPNAITANLHAIHNLNKPIKKINRNEIAFN